jgi:hypothetical protein
VGAFDPSTGTWFLRDQASGGAANAGAFAYGLPGWSPVTGDWTGNGTTNIGVVDPSTMTWYLRKENSAGAPDAGVFAYGMPGWKPVAGDWSGAGVTGIGAFDPRTATWYLRNEASAGAPDAGEFQYGAPGWDPVVGDWTGNGTTTIGVVDPSTMTWYLRNTNTPGAPATTFQFGAPGWIPVVGDWDGNGTTTIGAIDPSTGVWYLRNENSAGAPDAGVFAYGLAGWLPVSGHWSGLATPQLAGALPGATPSAALAGDPSGGLTNQELQDTVTAAVQRLQQAGVSPNLISRLETATYEVGNLPAGTLGYTYASAHTVVIDPNAAGYGWFVDSAPLQDTEFSSDGHGGLAAQRGSAAAGKMDLLTVVLHEMGHLAGRRDLTHPANPDDLMAEYLAPGQRRTEALDAAFATL